MRTNVLDKNDCRWAWHDWSQTCAVALLMYTNGFTLVCTCMCMRMCIYIYIYMAKSASQGWTSTPVRHFCIETLWIPRFGHRRPLKSRFFHHCPFKNKVLVKPPFVCKRLAKADLTKITLFGVQCDRHAAWECSRHPLLKQHLFSLCCKICKNPLGL